MSKTHYEIPVDGKVLACLDESVYTEAVVDYASWAAGRLSADLVFLHALERAQSTPPVADYSGSIGIGTGTDLLQELADLDAAKNKLAIRQGRELLSQARKRAQDDGIANPDSLQRHGSLVETLTELEPEVRLFVLGKRGEAADFNTGHLGSNLERSVRAVHRPLLVTARQFKPVQRFAIAFDGSDTTRKCVEMVAISPLLQGLACTLIIAEEEANATGEALQWALQRLEQAGYDPQVHQQAGAAEEVIAEQVKAQNIDLLVMGAYGHSRIRHLIVGSTTTAVLRTCTIPVLLLR